MQENYLDLVFTKASVDSNGVKRWAATVSKFEVDKQGDEVTRQFFTNSIENIDKGDHPMPALVVSHFDDPRQEVAFEPTPDIFAAGQTTSLYIDRDQPKAKGIFNNSPLGDALYLAVKSDIERSLPHEERVRISMAWRPLDGGVEKSGNGHVLHTEGVIRHFAATRVPIIEETDIMVQKSAHPRSKRDDAITIIGEDLAEEQALAYGELVKNKSDDEGIVEKAHDDGSSDEPSHKKKRKKDKDEEVEKAGKFDMGACLTTKREEGIKKDKALAICLDMAREAGEKVKPAPEKSNVEVAMDVEKAHRSGKFDMQACRDKQIKIGATKESAEKVCIGKAKKFRGQQVLEMASVIRRKKANLEEVEKIDLSVPLPQCIKIYVEDKGMTREEAIEKCHSDEAKEARAGATESEETEKANYNLDEVLDMIISDSEVQVVTKADEAQIELADAIIGYFEEVETLSLDDVNTDEMAIETIAAEVVTAEPAVVNTEADTMDVNVSDDVANKSDVKESNNVAGLEEFIGMFKSALVNDEMDRTQKVLIVNHAMQEMGNLANEYIHTNTPASPQDEAEMIKAALEEVTAPMAMQIDLLVGEVNDLRAKQENTSQGSAPQPKQLRAMAPQKAELVDENDTGGALTASQMAKQSVQYSQDGVY